MNPEFWIDRWQSGRIGFHQDAVHPELRDRWSELGLSPGATVLAPLCGKSLDMRWLAERGHRVVGIELSELAVRAFFEEGREAFQIEDARHHRRYRGARVELLAGDFFAVEPSDLPPLDAFYDRAALVALPDELRSRYVAHLAHLLPSGCPGVLVSMVYDPKKMSGPPFSVPAAEVERLWAERFEVELLSERSGPEVLGNLAARGLDELTELTYRMRRR
ncbi:MAG: thiopurine S-methyltransferase [Planctomycetes bacterium]|nr:thiopurine S-methyltransferase [Planctomycetota bacterium]MCB9889251.1 thiopurine S-methyltransferase [Planctomycetota bacterium]